MKNCIKVELWKAVHNSYFNLALITGLLLALYNFFTTLQTVPDLLERSVSAMSEGLPIYNFKGASLFIWWTADNLANFGSVYFFQIWPLIAAIPFAWSYSQESKSGSIVQYVVRMNRKQYFAAKYIAVFVTGGLVVAIPVFTDLMINALICPAENLMFYNQLTGIYEASFLSKLFFTHPFFHALIWCGIDFLFGGSASVLCFLLGGKPKYIFIASVFPFAFLYTISVIGTLVMSVTGSYLQLSILNMAQHSSAGIAPGWLLFAVIALQMLLPGMVGFFRVVKNDIL